VDSSLPSISYIDPIPSLVLYAEATATESCIAIAEQEGGEYCTEESKDDVRR
jgi:hypothetical protein